MAWPSKSGMPRAIDGIPATSDWETGMIPLASIGTVALVGQRLGSVRRYRSAKGVITYL